MVEQAPLGVIYNVGPPEPISIRDLVLKIAGEMSLSFEKLCEVTEARLGDDALYWLDSNAIKRDVEWEPEIGLEKGIREMVEWAQEHLSYLRTLPADYVLHA